jgi:hypothetical protein
MLRTLGILIAALLLAAVAAGEASAQQKKKNPKCVANFHEACMKRCVGAGGQARFSPQYCQRQERELGC